MRIVAAIMAGALAACSSGVRVPDDQVIYEVPQTGTASTAGGADPFTQRIESTLSGTDPATGQPIQGTSLYNSAAPNYGRVDYAQPLPAQGTPLDDDRLNLMQYTLEQQKIDAAIAERQLAEARSRLVVVPPEASVPNAGGANIALYAQQTSNQLGQRIYSRGTRLGSGCGRYSNPDEAQRAFLSSGGPETDSLGLDQDGDGFACSWDPAPYRQLKL